VKTKLFFVAILFSAAVAAAQTSPKVAEMLAAKDDKGHSIVGPEEQKYYAGLNDNLKELLNKADDSLITERRLVWGLGLLGFASLYREGFEVVLFLQGYYLQMGAAIVLGGAFLGIILSALVAVLTFVAHSRLPYRKLLIATGVMLGFVLLIMVGEQAQEMQLAQWIPTTKIPALETVTPDWMGVWFSVYPTVETLAAQAIAAILVIGSYYAARRQAASAG